MARVRITFEIDDLPVDRTVEAVTAHLVDVCDELTASIELSSDSDDLTADRDLHRVVDALAHTLLQPQLDDGAPVVQIAREGGWIDATTEGSS